MLDVVRSGRIGEVRRIYLRRAGYLDGISGGPPSWRTDARQRCRVASSRSPEMDILFELSPGVVTVYGDVLQGFPDVPMLGSSARAWLAPAGPSS